MEPIIAQNALFRVFNCARFAYHRHANLSGILHVVFDLLGDIARQHDGAKIVYDIRSDDDSNLATGLDSERLFNPFKRVGKILERRDSLEIGLKRPATGAWPGVQAFGGWKGSGLSGKGIGSFYSLPLYMHEQSQTVFR